MPAHVVAPPGQFDPDGARCAPGVEHPQTRRYERGDVRRLTVHVLTGRGQRPERLVVGRAARPARLLQPPLIHGG